jgi:hypothetical protein
MPNLLEYYELPNDDQKNDFPFKKAQESWVLFLNPAYVLLEREIFNRLIYTDDVVVLPQDKFFSLVDEMVNVC